MRYYLTILIFVSLGASAQETIQVQIGVPVVHVHDTTEHHYYDTTTVYRYKYDTVHVFHYDTTHQVIYDSVIVQRKDSTTVLVKDSVFSFQKDTVFRKDTMFAQAAPSRVYNVLQLGLKASGTTFDNYARAQTLLDSLPAGSTLFFPAADNFFYFSSTLITPIAKELHIKGDSYNSTVLSFAPGKAGIVISRANYLTSYSSIENLKITCTARSSTDGKKADGTVSLSFDTDYKANGIEIYAPAIVSNVYIFNMSGNGILMQGNLPNSNVSGAQTWNVQVQQVGGCGMYVAGADANAVSFYGNNIRDVSGYGFYDGSFLGSEHFGGMYHNDKMGHFNQTNVNAVTGIFGVYFEGDNSGDSHAAGRVNISGGYQGKQWIGGTVDVQTGSEHTNVFAKRYQGTYEQVGISRDATTGIPALLYDAGTGQRFYTRNVAPAIPSRAKFVTAFGNVPGYSALTDNISTMTGADAVYDYYGRPRYLRTPQVGSQSYFIQNTFFTTALNTTAIPWQTYFTGDKIYNTDTSVNRTIDHWNCIKSGTVGAVLSAYNTRVSYNAGDTILTCNIVSNQLHETYYVNINGVVRYIKKISGTSITVDQPMPDTQSLVPINYEPPIWKAIIE